MRDFANKVPAHIGRRTQLRATTWSRGHAAMLGQQGVAARKWAVLDIGNLGGRGPDQLLDAGGIVDAGQLDKDLIIGAGASVLLNRLFREAELVDAVGNGVHGALHRVALERDQLGRPEAQRVIGGAGGRELVRGVALGDDAAEGTRLGGRHALDADQDIIGVGDGLGLVAVHRGPLDVLLLEVFLQPLHHLVGVGFHGVLYLYFQHQVAAALEIEAEADVLLQVLHQGRLGGG
jgi:hypothetical protein